MPDFAAALFIQDECVAADFSADAETGCGNGEQQAGVRSGCAAEVKLQAACIPIADVGFLPFVRGGKVVAAVAQGTACRQAGEDDLPPSACGQQGIALVLCNHGQQKGCGQKEPAQPLTDRQPCRRVFRRHYRMGGGDSRPLGVDADKVRMAASGQRKVESARDAAVYPALADKAAALVDFEQHGFVDTGLVVESQGVVFSFADRYGLFPQPFPACAYGIIRVQQEEDVACDSEAV